MPLLCHILVLFLLLLPGAWADVNVGILAGLSDNEGEKMEAVADAAMDWAIEHDQLVDGVVRLSYLIENAVCSCRYYTISLLTWVHKSVHVIFEVLALLLAVFLQPVLWCIILGYYMSRWWW